MDVSAKIAKADAAHITLTTRDEYVRACRVLNIHPGRGLQSAKERARFFLDTCTIDSPLRHKAAATTILRTTMQGAKPY